MPVNERSPQPLPNLSDPVVDRNRRFTPTWYRWIKPLLDTTIGLKQSLVATDAVVTSNTAAITLEQQVRAAADSALASSVSTLTTTVGQNTTSISSLQSSVDGIEAQWAITINTNGHVTGRVRLDGGATGSEFSVISDKFIIYNPDDDGQSVQVVVVADVDGVPTLGIDGNIVLKGTISADRLNVNTLSAINADLGNINAGRITGNSGKMVIDVDAGTIDITA